MYQCINGSHTKQKLHRKLFINPASPSSSFLCAVLSLDVCPLDYPCERLLRTVLLVPVTLQCPVPVTGGAKTSTPGILKLGRGKKEEEKEPECFKIKAPQSFKALPGVNILWIPKAFFFSFLFFVVVVLLHSIFIMTWSVRLRCFQGHHCAIEVYRLCFKRSETVNIMISLYLFLCSQDSWNIDLIDSAQGSNSRTASLCTLTSQ